MSTTLSRWLAPIVLLAGFGALSAVPAPARAQSGDDLVRVIVDVADVILRDGHPYYRYGDYGRYDRLVVERDYRGRPVYYRTMPRHYRSGPPYGVARGHDRDVKCNRNGRCQVKTTYYDPRYDRDRYDRYDRHDRRDRRHDWRRDRRHAHR